MYYSMKGHVLQHERACVSNNSIFIFVAVTFNNLCKQLMDKAL